MKGGRRLKRDQLDRRVELPQTPRAVPMNVPLVPETRHEVRERAAGLLDDLGPGRVVVRHPVAVVVVLVRIEVAIGFLRLEHAAPRGSRRRCSRAGLVRTSSAPNAFRMSLRSGLAFAGTHSLTL